MLVGYVDLALPAKERTHGRYHVDARAQAFLDDRASQRFR
jgi:hypothetical protein